ncbi:MAG: hypothetical protein H0U75_01070 [Legionella sp.]|nr:hypothetical protein [Legionella sp.]
MSKLAETALASATSSCKSTISNNSSNPRKYIEDIKETATAFSAAKSGDVNYTISYMCDGKRHSYTCAGDSCVSK